VPFCVEQVDSPAYAAQYSFPRLKSITQIALKTALDPSTKHFCHQIRDVIGVILYRNLCLFEVPEEIRRVQHKQPKVTHRDAADPANLFTGVWHQAVCNRRHN
jgi:hypothetical protein